MSANCPGISLNGLIIAEFLSLVASQVSYFVLPLIVLQQTQSTIITSAAILGNYLPFVVAAFLGGRVIYSFGPRRVSIAADAVGFLSTICLALILHIFGSSLSYAFLLSLVLLGALLNPIGIAARQTIVFNLTGVANKSVEKVNSIRGSLEHAADFIGPLIGIGLIKFVSVADALVVTALLFLCGASISYFTIPVNINRPGKKLSFEGTRRGIHFIFGHQSLKIFAIVGMIASFVISSFLGLLLLLLAIQVFNNTGLLAISLSVFSLSASITAAQFSKLKRRFSNSTIYYTGLLAVGLGIILSGIVTLKYGILLSCALAGLAGASNPLEQTVVQLETPSHVTGQVFSLLLSMRFAAGALGVLVAGFAARFYPVKDLCILEGGLLVVAAAIWWRVAPLKN